MIGKGARIACLIQCVAGKSMAGDSYIFFGMHSVLMGVPASAVSECDGGDGGGEHAGCE